MTAPLYARYCNSNKKFHNAEINFLCHICDIFERIQATLAQLSSNLCASTVDIVTRENYVEMK